MEVPLLPVKSEVLDEAQNEEQCRRSKFTSTNDEAKINIKDEINLQEFKNSYKYNKSQIRINNNEVLIKEELIMDIDIKEEPFLPISEKQEQENVDNKEFEDVKENWQSIQHVKTEVIDEVQDENSTSTNEDEPKTNSNASTVTISVRDINSLKKSTDGKNIVCTICNKKFTSKSILTRHLKIHKGIKEHECLECGRKFTQNSQVKKHMKIHLGIKEFECTMCDKKFRERGTLKLHLKFHLKIKDFECSFCKRKFFTRSILYKHMKSHERNKKMK